MAGNDGGFVTPAQVSSHQISSQYSQSENILSELVAVDVSGKHFHKVKYFN